MSIRQQVAFPTVAKIRKGTPKIKKTKDGRSYEVMGKDLDSKFRIEFLPGTEDIEKKFKGLYPESFVEYPENYVTKTGYEMEYIRAMIPTRHVLDSWRWSNETYNTAGMLVASSDGEKYLTKKDPITMETIVKNGEPYTKFEVGDAVSYEKNGKEYFLKLKSSGKLDLFLPDLGEFVSFELRTASYLDSLYIQKNLMAIQGIADVLNNGVAGGIPLDIYRVEMDSPYMSNGSSHKTSHWFIQIKANSDWASNAIARMNQYAFTGSAPMLKAPDIEIPKLPEVAIVDSEDEDGSGVEEIVGQIVQEEKEEVSENVQKDEDEVVLKEKHDKIVALYGEVKLISAEHKKKALSILKEYESEKGDIRKVSDLEKLKEAYNKLKQLKKER